jgi:cellulose synthase/poly-beta-1,6-N-acetylglucosamine synthase-like glycosyltransferase
VTLILELGEALLVSSALLLTYTVVGYPMVLTLLALIRRRNSPATELREWPLVSISLPVYNEEAQIREVIESLLALDYPSERRQIVVISDASTDGTDAIVREYAREGVELLSLDRRSGKTAAENAAAPLLRGEIVINTDASIRIHPQAVKHLVAWFADPTVGVASGRDVSVSAMTRNVNVSEAGYVNYEMRIRSLETRVSSIIGASGCLYAIRSHLHRQPLPNHLSRDFASALIAREHGYRSVSADNALCAVPRTGSLRQEYQRKVRTMSRGMETLDHKRHLLDPLKYDVFAWMLFSHKVCRWLMPIALLSAFLGIVLIAVSEPWARWILGFATGVGIMAVIGWTWPQTRRVPRSLALPASVVSVQIATLAALFRAVRGNQNASWEPTRRERPNSINEIATS